MRRRRGKEIGEGEESREGEEKKINKVRKSWEEKIRG